MSMICWVLEVSPSQMSALRIRPTLVVDVVQVATTDYYRRENLELINKMPPERRAAAEVRVAALRERQKAELEAARARIAPLDSLRPALDLEKSWHMLHYVFTGHADDAVAPGDALLTGEELGGPVAGYGPARMHDARATQQFGKFLESQDVVRLQERVKYHEMVRIGIYGMPAGGGSVDEWENELRGEVAVYFERLKDYVRNATLDQSGLLVWAT